MLTKWSSEEGYGGSRWALTVLGLGAKSRGVAEFAARCLGWSSGRLAEWQLAVFATLAMTISCLAGLLVLQWWGREVAIIWPASGVGVALVAIFGSRVLPWLALGAAVVLVWVPALRGVLLVVPLLYPLEAWLSSRAGFPGGERVMGTGLTRSLVREVRGLILAPWLGAVVCAILLSLLALHEGFFLRGSVVLVGAQVAVSHVHGMIAIGLPVWHLLRGDYQVRPARRSLLVVLVGLTPLVVLVVGLVFGLGLWSQEAAVIYLPLPFLLLAAVVLRRETIALVVCGMCLISSYLTSLGYGPFHSSGRLEAPLELGVYNIINGTAAYLLTLVIDRLSDCVKRHEIALVPSGIFPWSWSRRDGLQWTGEGAPEKRPPGWASPEVELDWMATMSGVDRATDIPDAWEQRLRSGTGGLAPVYSVGRVLRRSRAGEPREVHGLLQDLSGIRQAEDALIESERQRALARSLQYRLNPHFLFNALNTVRALIHQDVEKGSEAVTVLSRLLRSSLGRADRPLVTLGDEMESVSDLLHIARLRFGERLRIECDLPEACLQARIPPLVLFNLVENALVHGVEARAGANLLRVGCRTEDLEVVLEVQNNGQLPDNFALGEGIRNTRKRLELIYGSSAELHLEQRSADCVVAVLRFPLQNTAFADACPDS